MMKTFLVLSVVCLFSFVNSEDGKPARLLASKTILNQYLVEGKDLTVEYNIYNVGESTAVDVQLVDMGFPQSDFETVRGSLRVKWERIAPGTNVSHAAILSPLKPGYFNFTAAEVRYQGSEENSEVQLTYTTAPGEEGIVSRKDYDRKFSPHVIDWVTFAIMTLPSIGFPFMLWYSSKSKYDTKPKKN
ncbi:translocon-associated protein subunit beta [Lingula anatina]|uniref:Translocon-associated protein subunit beta n=1 Tax=Lingula anatina TaxID=7574 RepID=A0A1S3IY22_LINAN|nr:translocon-associated protein subunit beta [Lingula anatina]|eukprot:XP_013403097.1 translocon-associated protein subunit beta [Lingula anatina]